MSSDQVDYVNKLNTIGLLRKKKITYEYSSTGPLNNQVWNARVYFDEEYYGEGNGRTKRKAQASAAEEAMKNFQ
ncbi:hypothetical protein C0995_015149 [Termitomyces sp. Mi166|nr:hypothetical protein C0995_015149 [Termitomyces sp. Mi166\